MVYTIYETKADGQGCYSCQIEADGPRALGLEVRRLYGPKGGPDVHGMYISEIVDECRNLVHFNAEYEDALDRGNDDKEMVKHVYHKHFLPNQDCHVEVVDGKVTACHLNNSFDGHDFSSISAPPNGATVEDLHAMGYRQLSARRQAAWQAAADWERENFG